MTGLTSNKNSAKTLFLNAPSRCSSSHTHDFFIMTLLQQSLKGNLENALRNRQNIPLEPSWERETGRGLQHTFGEYRLSITTSNGQKEDVIILEDCSMISRRVWDCSVMTAKWLENLVTKDSTYPDLARSLGLPIGSSNSERPLQVLELGAGTGLLTVFLAKIGAAVLSTEYGASVKYLQENCDFNNVRQDEGQTKMTPGTVRCRELDWYKATETLETIFLKDDERVFDLIVVTDCNLTRKDSEGVIDMINKYATKGHTRAIVGLCNEREGTPYFIERASKLFQNVASVPQSQCHPDFQSRRHTILTFNL